MDSFELNKIMGAILGTCLVVLATSFAADAYFAPTMPAKPVLFLRAVTTHEFGHLIGLAHDCGTGTEAWPTDLDGTAVAPCEEAPMEIQASTMFYAVGALDDGPSTLSPDDIAGACAIAAQLACTEDTTAGCSASAPASLWPACAILALLRRRRRRA